MNAQKTESASLWTKAPVANLVRYESSGIYFARAKVRGKLIRKSLETNVLSVAKLRLADVLNTENKASAPSTKIIGKMLFSDALALFKERQRLATDVKQSTKDYNERAATDLLKTWPGLEHTDVKRITKFECLEWRAKFGKMYSPTVTNGTLSVLRRVLDIAVDSGARYDNPARHKDVKRARVRRKDLKLPEPDQFIALVAHVRGNGSGRGGHSAGRTLPANYREFVRGYAITSYGSQGKTVEHVLFSDSTVKAATNNQQWLVTISRGTKAVKIFTSNKEQLRENVNRMGDRELAVEFVRQDSPRLLPIPIRKHINRLIQARRQPASQTRIEGIDLWKSNQPRNQLHQPHRMKT